MKIIMEIIGGKADGETHEQDVDVGDVIVVRDRSGSAYLRMDFTETETVRVYLANKGASVPLPR